MNSGSEHNVTKHPIGDSVTPEQIKKIIDERTPLGGDCEEVTENGKRFLVCVWAPL